jgi:arginase
VPQPEEQHYGEKRAKYLDEIAQACKGLAEIGPRKRSDEDLVRSVLGGDHSIAVGTTAGAAEHFNQQSKRVGVIWLDAHGDMNTPESSPSGNVHGMPLAAIMGYGPPELTGSRRLSSRWSSRATWCWSACAIWIRKSGAW